MLSSAERFALRRLSADGVLTQAMGSLTGGPFIVAYAATLGASNALVGFLASLPFLAQVLQLPAAALVTEYGRRRRIVIWASVPGRFIWIGPAVAPWLTSDSFVLAVVLATSLTVHFGLSSIANCAYSSWVRDVIPEQMLGRHFGRQLAIGTAVGAALRLTGGPVLDVLQDTVAHPAQAFTALFVVAALIGTAGPFMLRRVPEPELAPPNSEGLLRILSKPLKSAHFRPLLVFGAAWSFAINVAAPFVTLYMLQRLSMSMTWVVALSVASKVVNVAFFPIWGKLVDRFASKSVLGVSVALSIALMIAWPFTTLPGVPRLTIPLLIIIHLAAGVSTAGVTLGLNNIALKLAPKGEAAPFLAANAMVNGIAASASPIVAGLAADLLANERLTISLEWMGEAGTRFNVGAVDFRGLDFLFVASAAIGLYALHRLSAVREEGEVQERVVFDALYGEVRQAVREVSSLSGLNRLVEFPAGMLRRVTTRTPKDDDPE